MTYINNTQECTIDKNSQLWIDNLKGKDTYKLNCESLQAFILSSVADSKYRVVWKFSHWAFILLSNIFVWSVVSP